MPMVDPDTLIDNIVTTLRSCTALVSLLDGRTDNIIPRYLSYDEGQANIEGEQIEQPFGTIMVFWRGTRTGNFNRMESIKHDFGISIKPKGRVAAMFVAIREAECTTPEMRKFKLIQVNTAVRTPEDMQCVPAGQFVAQGYGLYDSGIITFTLTERGVDN
jgi:hypothetical protein